MKKSVTLAELVVASLLMGLVIVTPVAFELFVRRQYNIQDTKIRLLQETESVVEKVAKIVREGVGDASGHPAVTIASNDDIRINVDTAHTPGDFSDDVTARIYQNANIIYYDPDTSVAGDEVRITESALNPGGLNIVASQNAAVGIYRIDITVTLVQDPSQAADPVNNPSVTTSTFVTTNTSVPWP